MTATNLLCEQNTVAVSSDLSLIYPAYAGKREFQAIEGLNFTLKTGEIAALLGESGSGKSTLARFFAGRAHSKDKNGRISVAGGTACVLGQNLCKLSRGGKTILAKQTGFLPQNAGATLTPELCVRDILFEPFGRDSSSIDFTGEGERIAEMLDIVQLPLRKLQEYPYELSKGQRQRIAVIRSLMLQPQLLVVDEPTLGVDAIGRPQIIRLLAWYLQKNKTAMFTVSHDIALLEALAQKAYVLRQGQLVGEGAINDIFRKADHGYVQQLAQALRGTAYDELAET